MNNFKNEQSHFFEYVKNSIINNKKISHAYLIETNGYVDYMNVAEEFIKIILCIDKNEDECEKISYLIDNGNYVDLKYIYPDGAYIKKEQLLQLENQFMKKSALGNKMIYVIDKADKLNQSSANTILKFLEEPPDDIIAVLITENKYNVLETIVSRCQVLSLINNVEISVSDEIYEFVNDVFSPKNILINFDYYLEKIFSDRVMANDSLKNIEEVMFKKIKDNLDSNKYNFLINQIALIELEKERLNYNVNIKLWFTNYIFNIMEVKFDA